MNQIIQNLFKVSEIDIVYKNTIDYDERIKIQDPETAYRVLKQAWNANKIDFIEEFKVLFLDQDCNCLGISEISVGSLNGCLVDSRVVFAAALKAKATRIILAHNHPSGNLSPSQADRNITKRFVEVGNLMEINIQDHIIVASNGYYSFSNEGLIYS